MSNRHSTPVSFFFFFFPLPYGQQLPFKKAHCKVIGFELPIVQVLHQANQVWPLSKLILMSSTPTTTITCRFVLGHIHPLCIHLEVLEPGKPVVDHLHGLFPPVQHAHDTVLHVVHTQCVKQSAHGTFSACVVVDLFQSQQSTHVLEHFIVAPHPLFFAESMHHLGEFFKREVCQMDAHLVEEPPVVARLHTVNGMPQHDETRELLVHCKSLVIVGFIGDRKVLIKLAPKEVASKDTKWMWVLRPLKAWWRTDTVLRPIAMDENLRDWKCPCPREVHGRIEDHFSNGGTTRLGNVEEDKRVLWSWKVLHSWQWPISCGGGVKSSKVLCCYAQLISCCSLDLMLSITIQLVPGKEKQRGQE